MDALSEVYTLVEELDIKPIIHIEAHGSSEGLTMESGEMVSWTDVTYLIREINILTKNNLMLVLASCYGISIDAQLNILLRAPFWVAVAPLREVGSSVIEVGFTDFYEKITNKETDNFEEAILALNQYGEEFVFQYIDPELRFEGAWDMFRQEYDSIEKIHALADFYWENGNIDSAQKAQQFRQHLVYAFYAGDNAKQNFKSFFLMHDLQGR